MIIRPVTAGTRPGSDVAFSGITPTTAMVPIIKNTMNKTNSNMNLEVHVKNVLAVVIFSPCLNKRVIVLKPPRLAE